MANEQSGIPLRRWRPFYGAFVAIDEAIEEAGHPRAAFQDVRARIVKMLRAATDDGVAEQLCGALDDAMEEALETLRVTPVPHSKLASTDLARAVGALRKHGSARIRRLAGDVVRAWTTANDVARATAIKEIDKLSEGNAVPPAKIFPAAAAQSKLEAKKLVVAQKIDVKKPVMATHSKKLEAKKQSVVVQNEKMEITKRKLHEGYEEAEKLKLKHKIQKINAKEAPKLLERSQPKMQRAPARCRISSGVRRSLLPSLHLI